MIDVHALEHAALDRLALLTSPRAGALPSEVLARRRAENAAALARLMVPVWQVQSAALRRDHWTVKDATGYPFQDSAGLWSFSGRVTLVQAGVTVMLEAPWAERQATLVEAARLSWPLAPVAQAGEVRGGRGRAERARREAWSAALLLRDSGLAPQGITVTVQETSGLKSVRFHARELLSLPPMHRGW